MNANTLNFRQGLGWAALAVASFHLAYAFGAGSFLIAVCLFGLVQLSRVRTSRQAMNLGWIIGPLLYGPHLCFFWTIFGPGAITLWLVLAFWVGLFLVLLRACRLRFGNIAAAGLAPFLWTGLEFFRSEIYILRFSWLSPGFAFSDSPQLPLLAPLGVYGIGFVLMAAASALSLASRKVAGIAGGALLVALAVWTNLPAPPPSPPSAPATGPQLRVAGVQFEFEGDLTLLDALNKLLKEHPDTDLFVLSEYSFDGPVPDRIKAWCKANRRHLLAGGKDYFATNKFFNTAYVIGPDGSVVFQQAKAMPIQFFKDGQPAREQKVWDSPWGKLGVCICYDLSYARVVDELVRQGAQALLVPTMDVAEWGEYEHRLHSRVAPMRAAEYGLPIFRLASSGISQAVDARGRVTAAAPFPGEGSVLAAAVSLAHKGSRPLDRFLAPLAMWVSGVLAAWFAMDPLRRKFLKRP